MGLNHARKMHQQRTLNSLNCFLYFGSCLYLIHAQVMCQANAYFALNNTGYWTRRCVWYECMPHGYTFHGRRLSGGVFHYLLLLRSITRSLQEHACMAPSHLPVCGKMISPFWDAIKTCLPRTLLVERNALALARRASGTKKQNLRSGLMFIVKHLSVYSAVCRCRSQSVSQSCWWNQNGSRLAYRESTAES